MTRGIQTDIEAQIVAALEATPGATLAQLSDAILDAPPARIAASLHYLTQQAIPPRIVRTGETRWYRYWLPGTVPENPAPVPRDIRVGNLQRAPGHTAQLIDAVRANPGITAVELGKLTGIADGAKILAVLVKRRQMQAIGPRTKKRYYAIGVEIPAEAAAAATKQKAHTDGATLPVRKRPKSVQYPEVTETIVTPPPASTAATFLTAEEIRAAAKEAAGEGPDDPITTLAQIELAEMVGTQPDVAQHTAITPGATFPLDLSIDNAGRLRIQRAGESFTLDPREVSALHLFVSGTQPVWEGRP